MRDDGVGHALLADAGGERARIKAGDADDAARLEPAVEVIGGAVVGRIGDRSTQHAATHARARGEVGGLGILGVGADVADMRESEGDDLPGVGGIGQDLLVAGHGGVEADLTDGGAGGTKALAGDDAAVGQDEARRGRRFGPGCSRGGRARSGHG
jgi:hypothetical protein